MHLVISIALLCAIIGYEGWRRVTNQPFGLLSVANLIFALNYCVSPLLLAWAPGTEFAVGPYGTPLFILPIVEMLKLDPEVYVTASMVTVFAYLLMVGAYLTTQRFTAYRPLDASHLPTQWLSLAGLALGLMAIAALLSYSSNFRDINIEEFTVHTIPDFAGDSLGLLKMMKLGMFMRERQITMPWGFSQIIVMLGVPALFFLSTVGLRIKGMKGAVFLIAALMVWLAVVIRTYHIAGRMELAIALVMIPLAVLLNLRNKNLAALGVLVLMAFGMFIGLARHEFFSEPGQTLTHMMSVFASDFVGSVLYMVNEFAFPYPISVMVVQIVPQTVEYRYFIDLPLSILYMLPSLGGEDTWPEMISHIHLRVLQERATLALKEPYDLLSFGYYSWGVIGVGIVFVAMGTLLALFDKWLVPGTGWMAQCLRAAWMMYLPFRIMYADPYTAMKTGFGLIVGTIMVLVMVWLLRRRMMMA